MELNYVDSTYESYVMAITNSEDRLREYWEKLSKLSEPDRFAIRCGFTPGSFDYQKARKEMIRRRKAARQGRHYAQSQDKCR